MELLDLLAFPILDFSASPNFSLIADVAPIGVDVRMHRGRALEHDLAALDKGGVVATSY